MKKNYKFFGIVALIVAIGMPPLIITACEGLQGQQGIQGEQGIQGNKGTDGLNSYLVIFDSNGGIPLISAAGVSHGEKVIEPNIPVKNMMGFGEFIGWYSDKNLTTAFNFDTRITANMTLYAKWELSFKIGDTGPGGGKIFYRSYAGFTMTDTNEICHYLEVSPDDVGTNLHWASPAFFPSDWGGTGTAVEWGSIEGTEEAIGTGRKNTAIILAQDADAPAVKACNEYSNNGKNDWFLPSIDELWQLYLMKSFIGTFEPSYWSSTLHLASTGIVRVLSFHYIYDSSSIDPSTGMPFGIANAANQYAARAIRAF